MPVCLNLRWCFEGRVVGSEEAFGGWVFFVGVWAAGLSQVGDVAVGGDLEVHGAESSEDVPVFGHAVVGVLFAFVVFDDEMGGVLCGEVGYYSTSKREEGVLFGGVVVVDRVGGICPVGGGVFEVCFLCFVSVGCCLR